MLFRLLFFVALAAAALSFLIFAAVAVHNTMPRAATAAALFALCVISFLAAGAFLNKYGYARVASAVLAVPAIGLFALSLYVFGLLMQTLG